MSIFSKRSLFKSTIAMIVATSTVANALPAMADEAAEQFMTTVLKQANTIMAQTDQRARLDGIATMVEEFGDLRRTGRFTLGQYARRLSPEQSKAFYPLFNKYATSIYEEILGQYSGEQLVVTGSIDRSEKDIIVNSKVSNAKPGAQFSDTVVQWRLYKTPTGLKIVDAGADNIWLAIEQRSQFTAIIANNGGGSAGIDALIQQLKNRVSE